MDDLIDSCKKLSIEYTKKTDKEHLKKLGQYFTLDETILNELTNPEFKQIGILDVLEPSCGTGRIIIESLKKFKCNIDAIEYDKNVFDKTKELFKNNINVNIYNDDFLKYNFNKKYDIIIGNPPYFELKNDIIDEQFKQIICGRTNIYTLFIYKSIQLLKDQGELYFIIPKTILSGKYFSKLRIYIHQTCNIIDVVKFSKNNLFAKALQAVIILKLKKVELPNNNYTIQINNHLYFVKDVSKLSLNNNSTTIKKLNCSVKTGSVVWNQHKISLSSIKTNNTLPLIMSSNIKNNVLKFQCGISETSEKKQYLTITDNNKHLIQKGPYILINRIIGDPPKINLYFEKNSDTNYFIENHINIIKGSLESLTLIYNSLLKQSTITFIQELIGNTQLSQDELENIIPIFN